MRTRILALSIMCACAIHSTAQNKSSVKFGKVNPEDFKPTAYTIDSNANAVIIADIGRTEMIGNDKGGFSLEFKKYKRVHILNKNGYDAANVEIGIYEKNGAEEEVIGLKAVTYNLENGKVVETKLDTKSAIFKDRINKNLVVKKFTFPNLHEGSIIELEYKLKSDFTFNLQAWDFQSDIPCIWSEYTVSMPEFYNYASLTQGYTPYDIAETKNKQGSFTVIDNTTASASERSSFTAGVTDYHWVRKNVPALKEERYTSTLSNHRARIEFQLSELRAPFTPKRIMASWFEACDDLLKDEDFGYTLYRDNGWLGDEVRTATRDASNDIQKAQNIYAYVRDNFTCTNHNRKYLEHSLKNVIKAKSGNVAEINLLLTAMLAKVGLEAAPVLLSTRSNGVGSLMYPIMSRYNYVISRVLINDKYYYLDASHPRLGFNCLEYEIYNGYARVVNNEATAIPFVADSLMETKNSSIIISNSADGNLNGMIRQTPGYFESYSIRNKIKEKGKSQLFADIKKSMIVDAVLTEETVDLLDKYEEPIKVQYGFKMDKPTEDILYFTPLLGEGWKENPFKADTRNYPVEMPYGFDETVNFTMEVPAGYKIDELPKQIMVKLNEENEGFFEYRLSESNDIISLRSRVVLKRAYFQPDEYELLREFFNMVVKKHNEQIVFKKK